MIVKVQLALNGVPSALIYNEDRSLLHQCPADDVRELFDPGEVKVYFDAELVSGSLVFLERVGEQPW